MSVTEDLITIIREDPEEIILEITQPGTHTATTEGGDVVAVSVVSESTTTGREPGDTLVINDTGLPGPAGPAGPPGPDGPPGTGTSSYHHSQVPPSALWVVNHNLGFQPGGVLVFDTSGSQIEGDVIHIDQNTLHLDFDGSGFAGDAYLS